MAIHVRELTDEERAKIERLARSRTAPVRLVLRAKIIKLSTEGVRPCLPLPGNWVSASRPPAGGCAASTSGVWKAWRTSLAAVGLPRTARTTGAE